MASNSGAAGEPIAWTITLQIWEMAAPHALTHGDASGQVTVDARGEVFLLKDYVNALGDQPSSGGGASTR
jgi:hypothetical protein